MLSTIQYITVEEGLDLIQDNMHIVTGLGCSEAQSMLSALHTISDRISKLRVSNCLSLVDYDFLHEEYADKFLLASWFYSPPVRQMHRRGNATYIPNNLHFAGSKLLDTNHVNMYIGSCSEVDEHGYVSLSMGNTYERQMIDAADVVILEANPNFPRTFGDVEIHHSKIDHLIKVDYEAPVLSNVEPNEKDLKIGQFIADYIQDGDSIQLGIGGIPNAVAKSLYDKKDLGIHTEMLTSEMAKLAKAGVITGDKKTLHRGKMVTTFVMGDQELYDFVDNNPSVLVLAGSYVNDPDIIGLNDNQISINTTLEIDLTGQCASESIGSTQFSGTGGQTDTARGAQKSKNGKSFIALYSTYMAKDKATGERVEKSKIVPILAAGSIVSLSRNDTDYVVTEYGVAHLHGKTVQERVHELIKIAHPNFREELLEEALKLNIIGEPYEV